MRKLSIIKKFDNTKKINLKSLSDLIFYLRKTEKENFIDDFNDKFIKNLYSTYVSYLPSHKVSYSLPSKKDNRGNFIEFLKSKSFGQISIFSAKNKIRGYHFHNSKVEKFLVVKGKAKFIMESIYEKKFEIILNSSFPKVIESVPGWVHYIKNIGKTDLIVLLWSNEPFDAKNPDTFSINEKIKILTVVGTRPEIIRLSRVISLLENNLNSILIHTGQNYDYELNKIFFKDLGLKKPKYQINNKKNSNISCIANILIQIEKIIIKEKPDGFLVLGDTNSCLSAYVAKRYKVPIFHIEAGNRCYDLRVPEEINRRIIDNISDINITYSKVAKQNLIRKILIPIKYSKSVARFMKFMIFIKIKSEIQKYYKS